MAWGVERARYRATAPATKSHLQQAGARLYRLAQVNGTALAQAEGALLVNEIPVIVTAGSDATLLAFLINRRATLTHAGTIGG
jgi:hypothetical protein